MRSNLSEDSKSNMFITLNFVALYLFMLEFRTYLQCTRQNHKVILEEKMMKLERPKE